MEKVDIVVFGATGDTGRCCCHFLFNNAKLLHIKSWAPAARNLKKLDKLVGSAVSLTTEVPTNGVRASRAIYADSNDYESILAMVKQAKVVVACVGPFVHYGANVVKACAEAGTNYVDITGETQWVNLMAKRYHRVAQQKKISMVSQAAYDSVPSDITVALAALELQKNGETVAATETHHHVKGGAMPSGTFKTLREMAMHLRATALRTISFGMLGGASTFDDVKKQLDELKDRPGLVPKAAAKASSKASLSNNIFAYSPLSGRFTLPGVMAIANIPIVYTTAHALGYGGANFSYRERSGKNDSGIASLYGFLPLAATVVGLGIALPLLLPIFVAWPKVLLDSMESFFDSDPSNVKAKAFHKLFNGFQPNGLVAVKAYASSVSGKTVAEVNFESDYEAGLGFTALSAVTVAAGILAARERGVDGAGFQTAVVAVGPTELSEWYRKVGVRITCRVRAKL